MKIAMDILTVADCHGQLRERDLLKTLSGRKPDAVFFLGDNDADIGEELTKVYLEEAVNASKKGVQPETVKSKEKLEKSQ